MPLSKSSSTGVDTLSRRRGSWPPESSQTHRRGHRAAARAYALSISTRKMAPRFSVDDRCFVRSWYRARSSEVANRTRRIESLLQSGTPLDLIDLSLVSTLSSAQKASASWYFLAPKARSGLRSASMVKIESEGVSLISSPSARIRPGGRWRNSDDLPSFHLRGISSYASRDAFAVHICHAVPIDALVLSFQIEQCAVVPCYDCS
jgi:hypothetical protein